MSQSFSVFTDGKFKYDLALPDDNRLGGSADWIFSEPPADLRSCRACGLPLSLVVQLSAPILSPPEQARPQRVIYVLTCGNNSCNLCGKEYSCLLNQCRPSVTTEQKQEETKPPGDYDDDDDWDKAPASGALGKIVSKVTTAPVPEPDEEVPFVHETAAKEFTGFFLSACTEKEWPPVETNEAASVEESTDDELAAINELSSKTDPYYDRFQSCINSISGYVARYCLDGALLAGMGPGPLDQFTRTIEGTTCPHCGKGKMRLEAELLPTVIYRLRLPDSVDWHVLGIYTCDQLCGEDREWVPGSVLVVPENALAEDTHPLRDTLNLIDEQNN